MIKHLSLSLTLLVSLFFINAKAAEPQQVTWSTSTEQINDTLFRISATATILDGWHIYDFGPYSIGPTPTSFSLTASEGARVLATAVANVEPHRYYDDIFRIEIGEFTGSVTFSQEVVLNPGITKADIELYIEWMACTEGFCTAPLEYEETITIPKGKSASGKKAGGSLWGMILEAIIWGFAALLTPCVFPMVPMTVSFFMKGSHSKRVGKIRSILFGLFIILLYTVPIAAIILITRIFGGDAVTADIFNWLATNWVPNIIFFIVFMVFAASFLGAFEITLPGQLTTKTDSKSDNKGIGGLFFMALTLVLVSFACTGPIVGTVLIKSISGEFWAPIITMLFFSFAFALPFVLLSMFPNWLSKMPKSGGWLGSVKIILGFIEIALGFKFLSVIDQTYHWNFLSRDLYLAIWIVVFVLMSLFLFGVIGFSSSPRKRKWSVLRIIFAVITPLFVAYLVSGLFGAPMKGLSGYLPPMQEKGWFFDHTEASDEIFDEGDTIKYSDFLHLPHGINGFFDLDQARAYAKKVNKPLFIDFTGHGCVNCREMEARVWSDPTVLDYLKNKYVVVALYCDDKKQLPESQWVKGPKGKMLKTLGKINSYYAMRDYGVNAQPVYVLENYAGKALAEQRSYNLDVADFVNYLQSGLNKFNSLK